MNKWGRCPAPHPGRIMAGAPAEIKLCAIISRIGPHGNRVRKSAAAAQLLKIHQAQIAVYLTLHDAQPGVN